MLTFIILGLGGAFMAAVSLTVWLAGYGQLAIVAFASASAASVVSFLRALAERGHTPSLNDIPAQFSQRGRPHRDG